MVSSAWVLKIVSFIHMLRLLYDMSPSPPPSFLYVPNMPMPTSQDALLSLLALESITEILLWGEVFNVRIRWEGFVCFAEDWRSGGVCVCFRWRDGQCALKLFVIVVRKPFPKRIY